MVRNTLACLASAPSAVEVCNLHHQVRLDQGIILVYDMSIEVNDFQLVYKSLQQVLPRQSKTSPSGGNKNLVVKSGRECNSRVKNFTQDDLNENWDELKEKLLYRKELPYTVIFFCCDGPTLL